VGVDDKDLIPVALSATLDLRPRRFRSVRLEWDPENDGKTVYLVVGREASLHIEPPRKAELTGVAVDEEKRIVVSIGTVKIKVPADIQDHLHQSITIFSGTVTSSGNTSDIDVSKYVMAEIALNVTGVSGTNPVLNFYLEGKIGNIYKTIWAVEGITGVSTHFLTITHLAFGKVRARWTVSGTSPSFTIAVYLEGKA
jgi:hypothetical protein